MNFRIITILMITTMLLSFIGCGSTKTFVSYAPSITMSDGQSVTYKFTYSDGNTTTHTITKISDGDERGEIIYTIDNGKSFNYILSEIASQNISLSNEQSFLLFHSRLLIKVDNSIVNDSISSVALEFTEPSCNETILTVIAGEFPATMCTYSTKDNSETFITYSHNSLGANTPLDGLLKYQEINSNQEVTVELINWNGL